MTNVQNCGIAQGTGYVRAWNLYQPTSRNHYNPCFWVALWNKSYFQAWQSGMNSWTAPSAITCGACMPTLPAKHLDLPIANCVREQRELASFAIPLRNSPPDPSIEITPRYAKEVRGTGNG